MPTPTPPEAIDLLLAAGALERAAITANPARRCPLERVAEYLRKLVPPVERKPISEWRAPLDTFPSTPPAAAWDAPVRFEQLDHRGPATPAPRHFCCGERCPGLSFSVKDRAHPPSCLGDTQTHQGRTRDELERCECGAALLHVAGPNVSGTVCPECNADSTLLIDDDPERCEHLYTISQLDSARVCTLCGYRPDDWDDDHDDDDDDDDAADELAAQLTIELER